MDVHILFKLSHNFNGTSKGVGETLTRPCVPASQVPLNQIRRAKA